MATTTTTTSSSSSQENPKTYEESNVHQVYQAIAPHFSSTRHKPWPLVSTFLSALPPGSIGLDIGCGNGKYLPCNPDIFIIASDRSPNLISIARQHEPHSAIVADCLDLPHRLRGGEGEEEGGFDFAISIAVIHHLSTPERRVEGVRAVLETLRVAAGDGIEGGRALFYVWALEQKDSRRGWEKGDEQDVMVPWVMKQGAGGESVSQPKTFKRYYHLYHEGELERDILDAGGLVVQSGYERDNWWAIAVRKPLS